MATTQKQLEADEDAEVERVFRFFAQQFGERDAALLIILCNRSFDKWKPAPSLLHPGDAPK